MALLDSLLQKSGMTREDLITSSSRTARVFRTKGVPDGDDITRALAMPRRVWSEDPELPWMVQAMTQWLKTPHGTWTLLPIQAVALQELYDVRGCFAPILVGGGKTLISLLAPIVMGAKSPLLVVPAALRDKTIAEIDMYRRNWTIKPMHIQSYSMLSMDGNSHYLAGLNPDLIIFDEVQKLKNKDAAVTRKVQRFLDLNPNVPIMAMSGSITQESILDYAHILRWVLKEDQPLPSLYPRITEWAYALDNDSVVTPTTRLAPGALLRFADPHDPQNIVGARIGYRKRLTETPGVVASSDPPLAIPLSIREAAYVPSDTTVDHFQTLREFWETPDGHPCMDGHEIWRHARELICGFYYVWDPRPPATEFPITDLSGTEYGVTWLAARRGWAGLVRYVLKHNRQNLDSELAVRNAVRNGELNNPKGYETIYSPEEILRAWTDIAPTFTPNNKAVWFDDGMLNLCRDWLNQGEGIVWVEHTAFGERLSKLTGLPCFGRKGLDANENMIMDAKGPIIARIGSNGTGWNLQRYNRNLVVSPPSKGWEQLLGREHRLGQTKPVTFEIVLACIEQLAAFHKAIDAAQYVTESIGQIQKLTYANINVSDIDEATFRDGPLWNKDTD